jgi:type I restriction enzyme R subunit
LDKRRFLIELPTGTGKTDLICLYLQRLIKAGRAERILFLVDRDQLAKQAIEALQDILSQYGSYWLKPGAVRQEKQITVCLLQTMIGRYQEFTSGYFDVVIADECHRSICGAWQTALTHFDALHIDLTATPSAYIERNTFQFYHRTESQPDFAYSIQQAFREEYLVPYKFSTGITVFLAEGTDVEEERYDPSSSSAHGPTRTRIARCCGSSIGWPGSTIGSWRPGSRSVQARLSSSRSPSTTQPGSPIT